MNTTFTKCLTCQRCGTSTDERNAFGGCEACAAEGVAVNLLPAYDLGRLRSLPVDDTQPGIFRFRELLPIGDRVEPVSLSEGSTPLIQTARLGAQLGLDRLYFKDESRNPTWSYKDRLAAVAVTKAVEWGAETVVVATTGNHGAAVAAFAAVAGLRCIALTLESVPKTMKVLMQSYGAEVVALEKPMDRWKLMAAGVKERGWVPMSGYQNPPVGSNPFGIDGYKTIAYELFAQLGDAPNFVVIPAAYGDGVAGIERGFADLHKLELTARVPRLVAAEPFGPYAHALRENLESPEPVPAGPSIAFSTATPVGTYQALAALRRTGGSAIAVSQDDVILEAQSLIARSEGLFVEAAPAVCIPAIARLISERVIDRNDVVVALGTSTGLKDIDAPSPTLPPVPVIDPTLRALDHALEAVHR